MGLAAIVVVFRSFLVFLHLRFSVAAAIAATMGSYSTVEFLPGFTGPLPFQLETGYVGLGDWDEIQIFHYFIKSEGNPQTDPLILWLTGGPGCSALSGLAFEIGPIGFKEEPYNGSLPQLFLSPDSWTKKSSIIFVDVPVGTGFSYDKTSTTPKKGDFSHIRHCLQFLRKWLVDHPEFITNPFYVAGDSYSGLIVPVVAHEILKGNKNIFPSINFQGYILGNPFTIRDSADNFAIPFAHRMTLISDELYESLKGSCKGNYVNIDPTNVECLRHYQTYEKCISEIKIGCILLPKCSYPLVPRQPNISARRSLYNAPNQLPDPIESPIFSLYCAELIYALSYYWANDYQVRKALHIREGSIGEWMRCISKEDYTYEIESVFPYHVNLSTKGYRSLIYSGDHDMLISHLDTQAWIKALNYSIVDDWRPWFISDAVAGYTRSYSNKMTFATIKGGGHTAEYKRRESNIMFSRWISQESL